MPKPLTKNLIFKDNIKIYPNFYKTCILDKQYNVHSIDLIINIIKKSKIFLHTDLFNKVNILSNFRNYRYRVIFMDKTTKIKISISIKSKNIIYNENKFNLRKVLIFISKKIQYFQFNNDKKY